MVTVLFGVIGFTVVILALVLVLMFAREKLVPSGDVSIVINDDPDHTLTTQSGSITLRRR